MGIPKKRASPSGPAASAAREAMYGPRKTVPTVVLNAEYIGQVASPFGDTRVGFTASTKINREDFGLTWNVALEAGGVLVGKDIKVELDVEAVLVTEGATATA